MSDSALVVVQVEDVVDAALTGREGCIYLNPPQPENQALTLVRVLLGYTVQEFTGWARWHCAVAGGLRTVMLRPLD